VPSKQQVLDALRRSGDDLAAAGRELGIPPGQVHMLATGLPADGTDASAGPLDSPQRLVNPAQHNPLRKEHVVRWVRERAARDLTEPR
jgi:hypothetical protein